MKRYRPRLERLEKLRRRTLEQKQVALAEALRFDRVVGERIDEVGRLRDEEKAALRATLQEKPVPIDRVIRTRTYDGILFQTTLRLRQQLEQIGRVIADRRAELVEAERDVKVLENLSERLGQRYDRALERADLGFMDELAGQAAARKASSIGPK